MRRVLPGGATLSGSEDRPVAIRRGAAVVERTRPRRPADPPKAGASQAAAGRSAPGPPPRSSKSR